MYNLNYGFNTTTKSTLAKGSLLTSDCLSKGKTDMRLGLTPPHGVNRDEILQDAMSIRMPRLNRAGPWGDPSNPRSELATRRWNYMTHVWYETNTILSTLLKLKKN
jgi:hypothetical protein